MQTTKPRPAPTTTDETVATPSDAHGVDLADAILDEIDKILEETDTQRAYVQRGGQ